MAELEPPSQQQVRNHSFSPYHAEESHEPKQKKKLPKVWDIEDEDFEFTYAPPKPDGDPWNVLLKPLMEKDKIRCDAWKEEVQNLLIFAGLFSAVVTAFVIESYKTLQPDPNDAIVGLLSHIATRLDNSQNISLESSSITNPASFSPTSSSIRVNIFWFLSLILSLTTVLVGIVTLQWLREYQSYPGLTPKQSLAVFRMRSEGMEKWYVWKIFTALPLLLQAALVLFFTGVIDFLHALENKVAIPIAVVIGLTLLFLVSTTALPTLQGLFLYFPFLFNRDLAKEPSQCPYKSPQSQVLRASLSFSFHLFHHIFPSVRPIFRHLYSIILPIFQHLRSLCLLVFEYVHSTFGRLLAVLCLPFLSLRSRLHSLIRYLFEDEDDDHHVIPHILITWKAKTWRDFDSAWLLLRDACVQGMNDQRPHLNDLRKDSSVLPLFDSVRAIQEAIGDANLSHADTFQRSATYHAFSELSRSVTGLPRDSWDSRYRHIVHRLNRYFYALWKGSQSTGYEHEYKFIEYRSILRKPEPMLLHCQNLDLFILNNLYANLHTGIGKPLTSIRHHLAELRILSAKCWGKSQPIRVSSSGPKLQVYLPCHLDFGGPAGFQTKMLFWQFSHVLMAFFKYATDNGQNIGPGYLHAYPGVVDFLRFASRITSSVITFWSNGVPDDTTAEDEIDLPSAYRAIFVYIAEQLNQSLSTMAVTSDDTVPPEMSYLLYTSAMFVRSLELRFWDPYLLKETKDSVRLALSSMHMYRVRTGGVNRFLEDQFKGMDLLAKTTRFSVEWWSFLDHDASPAVPEFREHQHQASNSWPLDSEHLTSSPSDIPEASKSNDNANQVVGTSTVNDAVISIEYLQSQSQAPST